MLAGILAGLLAGAFWGLSFVLPRWLQEVPAEWIAFGRFMIFGVSSLVILLFQKKLSDFRKLFGEFVILAITGYSFYFCLCVMAIHYVGVNIPSLVVGIIPLTTALLGKEVGYSNVSFKKLLLPFTLVFAGLLLVDIKSVTDLVTGADFNKEFLLGTFLSFVCLFLWTYYAVRNSKAIKRHRNINAVTWTSATGVAAMLTSIVFLPLMSWLQGRSVGEQWLALQNGPHFQPWIIGCLILGIACSWIAIFLWNFASQRLSGQQLGQLIVSETIFAVIYGWILDQRLPLLSESLALVLLVIGVLWAVRIFHLKPVTPGP